MATPTGSWRISIVLLAVLTTATAVPPASAQTTSAEPARRSFTDWLPGLSFGVGMASLGTEGTPPWPLTVVKSVRLAPTRHFVIEMEWMERTRGSRIWDSEPGIVPLNGQPGNYGRHTQTSHYEMKFGSLAILGRTEMGPVSFLGGVGIGDFDRTEDTVSSRTGCTGPWVVYCASSPTTYRDRRLGRAFVGVGSVEINLFPRVDVYLSGRIGGANAVEEGAIAVGLRAAVLPYPRARRKPADSLLNGVLLGLIAGTGAGLYIEQYDEPRTIPAAALVGMALGALIDLLNDR